MYPNDGGINSSFFYLFAIFNRCAHSKLFRNSVLNLLFSLFLYLIIKVHLLEIYILYRKTLTLLFDLFILLLFLLFLMLFLICKVYFIIYSMRRILKIRNWTNNLFFSVLFTENGIFIIWILKIGLFNLILKSDFFLNINSMSCTWSL